ncbi:unnamed protein product [Withania somnifera]
MGDLPCPPYSSKRLEARIISKEKLPKICLVASATKHFSAKTLRCIIKVKQIVQTSGAAGDVVFRRLSKVRCPFIWHGLQALHVLCYPPLKWIQNWAPLKPLVRQLPKLSRPRLLLYIATVFSNEPSSTVETSVIKSEKRKKLNDDELHQFYAATNGDFARLLSSVKKTIKWRQSYTFLSPEELEAWSPFIFWHGHDANQLPCLFIRLGPACSKLRSTGRSLLIKAVVSQIEHGILRLVNVEHPQIVLMDCEGLSPLGFPIHMMRCCAMLLQDHYPNRLSFYNHLDSIPPFLGGNCSCSKCSNRSNAEGKSNEATRTEHTPDHVNRSDRVTRTEPAPNQVKDNPEFNHQNVSNPNGHKEELIKTLIIGILMVWIFTAVIMAMHYQDRLPLLH